MILKHYLKLLLEASRVVLVQLVESDSKVANGDFSVTTGDVLIQSIMDEYVLRLCVCV